MCIPVDDVILDALVADQRWWGMSERLLIDVRRSSGKPVFLHTLFKVLLENPRPAEAFLSAVQGDAEDVENMQAMLNNALPRTSRYRSKGTQYIFPWLSLQRTRHLIQKCGAREISCSN